MKTIPEKLKEMGKKTCEDCIGCDYCSDYDKYDIGFIWSLPKTQDVRTECSLFKDKADVVPRSEVDTLKELNNQLEIDIVNANMNLDHILQEIDQIQKDKADVTYLKEQLITKAKQEVANQIFEEFIEALQGEIDAEDKQSRNAWEQSDIEGYHIHEYAEDKLDTFKIALSLYKKKYIGE